MSQPTLATLFAASTINQVFDLGITVARKLEVPVDTWQTGDPTRSLFMFLAQYLGGAFEPIAERYTASAFLGFARQQAERDPGGYPWLVRGAYETYGYIADEATFAITRMTLTNTAGALYTEADLAAGNIQYENRLTGARYTASSGPEDADGNPVPLRPVSTAGEDPPGNVVYQWISADEAGSTSAAAADEIQLLTAIPGVEATNPTAAQALDAESPASIEQGAREKLGPLSPKGPKDAYNSVAKDKNLTGTTGITRSRTFADSTTGVVTQYLAGPSGAVSSEDVALAEAAIVEWATPDCTTPVVASAVNLVINVTYELWLYDNVGQTSDEVKKTVDVALLSFFLARYIGGDIIDEIGQGRVFTEGIKQAIKGAFGAYFIELDLTSPASNVAVAPQEVPILGTTTATEIHFETKATA